MLYILPTRDEIGAGRTSRRGIPPRLTRSQGREKFQRLYNVMLRGDTGYKRQRYTTVPFRVCRCRQQEGIRNGGRTVRNLLVSLVIQHGNAKSAKRSEKGMELCIVYREIQCCNLDWHIYSVEDKIFGKKLIFS